MTDKNRRWRRAVAHTIGKVGAEPIPLTSDERVQIAACGLRWMRGNQFVPQTTQELDTLPRELQRALANILGLFLLPTTELVEGIRERVGGRTAIEIYAGNGALGLALGIPCTDNFDHGEHELLGKVRELYGTHMMYGPNVQRFEAVAAVKHFRPQVVVGSYVTQYSGNIAGDGDGYGVVEESIVKRAEEYILVGNESVHGHKRILCDPRIRVEELHHLRPFVRTRAKHYDQDRIWSFAWRKC